MPVTKVKKRSEADVLDQAIFQLIRAVKARASESGKSLSENELLRLGHSRRFIAKVKAA